MSTDDIEANEPELESVVRESMRRTSLFFGLGLEAEFEEAEFSESKRLEKSLGSLLSFLEGVLADPLASASVRDSSGGRASLDTEARE